MRSAVIGVAKDLTNGRNRFFAAVFFRTAVFVSCFVYDWVRRRRIHPANIVGLTPIMMNQMIQPIVLSRPAWTSFANAWQRLVA